MGPRPGLWEQPRLAACKTVQVSKSPGFLVSVMNSTNWLGRAVRRRREGLYSGHKGDGGPREGESKEGGPGLGGAAATPQGDSPATALQKVEGDCMKAASGAVSLQEKRGAEGRPGGGAARGGLMCPSLHQSELLRSKASREWFPGHPGPEEG